MLRGFRLLAVLLLLVLSCGPALARGPVPDLLVELPGPDVLRRGEREVDGRTLVRRTGPGIYENLARATVVSQELRFRRGVASGVEVALAGRLQALSATGVIETFRDGSPGCPTLAAEVKFRLPDPVWGSTVVFGTGASLVSARDRALLQPDDQVRLNPTYVLVSRPFLGVFRGELVFRRARVLSTDRNEGTNLTTFDAGLQCALPGWPLLELEYLSERLSIRTIGDYGQSLDYDGPTVNLGVRQALSREASAQAYVRRLNRPENLEVGLSYGFALAPPARLFARGYAEDAVPGLFTVVPGACVGAFHPATTRSTARPLVGVGLRLHDATAWPFGFDFLEYGLAASSWSSPFETLQLFEAEVLAFYPETPALALPHHFFFGLGLGGAFVERDGARLTERPIAALSGGLQVHAGVWSVEGRVKLIVGPHDPRFDVSGTCVQVAASCPLGFEAESPLARRVGRRRR